MGLDNLANWKVPIARSDFEKLSFDEVMLFRDQHGATPSWIRKGTDGFASAAGIAYCQLNGEFEFRGRPGEPGIVPDCVQKYAKSLELGEGGIWNAKQVNPYGQIAIWRAVRQDIDTELS